jgi:hypothetical protein
MSLGSDREPQPEHYSTGRSDLSTAAKWTTRDGRVLIITEISDDHLLNIHKKFPSNPCIKSELTRRGLLKKEYTTHPQYKYENDCNRWK